jgi:hypothetical protein
MNKRVLLKELPRSMCERAVDARKLAFKNSRLIDVDDEMLPWIYDRKNDVWLSFDGNYSKISPTEKREKELEKQERMQEYENISQQMALDQYSQLLYWSKVRGDVLKRDNNVCQVCLSTSTTKLHIHHILKRKEGGSDHLDNLITVCPSCHKKAYGKLYNPLWVK